MNGKDVIERWDQLESLRSPHEWLWHEIGFLTNSRYFDKRKGRKTDGNIPHSEIYDTTLRTKSRMQANGITSMLFPRDRDWLVIKPPWELRNNSMMVKRFREIGEAVMHHLRESNFHHQNHGVISHRSQLGTGTMLMEITEDDNGSKIMNFRKSQPMTYLIDHDSRSMVDTYAVEYYWSAAQAANEWGLKNLSPKLQKEATDIKKRGETHCFKMLIEKRPSWERDKSKGNKGMLYRMMVVEEDGKHVVLDSGQEKFQIVASRYEVEGSPWGYSPAWEILPDAYKANFCAKFMMVMGERAAVPPVMAPASMKEEGIGLGGGEVTYISDLNQHSRPYELASNSNFQVGMDIWNQLRSSIDEAFHGNLFNMFSRQQRERTATEITAMQGELNAQLDPTITALTQDHTGPVVRWVIDALDSMGIIDIPDEARDQNTGRVKPPQFAYDNAITMNHKRMKALEAMGIVDALANLQAAGFDVDVVNLQETAMRIWRDQGQDEDELYSEEEIQAKAEAKEAAMQQAQALEAAEKASVAAKNAGAAGIDVSRMIGGAA